MNRPISTNTMPQIQNVRITVKSMYPQLEAISVNCHGLKNDNSTETMTMMRRKIATVMLPLSWLEWLLPEAMRRGRSTPTVSSKVESRHRGPPKVRYRALSPLPRIPRTMTVP